MAFGIVQFTEGGERKVTLVRPTNGQPTGADGLMDPLAAFVEASSPALLREGSPGATTMAMAFFERERKAGRPPRILGAEGEWGITAAEVEALEGRGYHYDVDFGRPGERSVPRILASGIER